MIAAGMTPDPWQADLMEAHPERALLLCSRQAGKSHAVAAIGLEQALTGQVHDAARQPRPSVSQRSYWEDQSLGGRANGRLSAWSS